MATANTSGGDSGADATACARDFVLDRLREADSPMSPAELASEYGCTNGHVRNTLRDLREDGLVDRPSRGQYVALEAEESADIEAEPSESPTPRTPDADTEMDTDFRGGGGPRSEALVTEVEDGQESETMPTKEELDRQREQWEIVDDDQDENDDVEDDHENGADEIDVEAVDDTSESMGIPLPVSTGTVVVGCVVFLAVYYWFFVRSDSSDEEDDETAQESQQSQPQPSSGGLMGEAPEDW